MNIKTPLKAPIRAEGDTRPIKTRARKGNTGQDPTYIPPHMIPDQMDYQWVAVSVLGQPDMQMRSNFEMQGWEAVPALRHDGMFMPKGHQGEINYGGLVLMERPIELTIEARCEDQSRAREARAVEERNLLSGNIPGVTMDTQHPSARAVTRITKEVIAGNIPVSD